MADQELIIKISGDPSDYKAAVHEAHDATEELKHGLHAIAEIVAFHELAHHIYETVEAFHDQARALALVKESLQNVGLAGRGLAAEYKEIAEAIEHKTGIDAASILYAQGSAQAMLGQKEITERLTKAVVDFATVKGLGMAEAFNLIAKAANNGTEVLKRQGLTIQDVGTSTGRLRDITIALETQFGGAAEKMAKVSGGTDLLKASIEDLEKKLGEKLAPMFDKVVGSLTQFFNWIDHHDELINFAADVAVGALAVGSLVTAVLAGQQALALLTTIMAAFGVTLTAATAGISLVVAALVVAIVDLARNWDDRVERMKQVWGGFVTAIMGTGQALRNFMDALLHFDLAGVKQAAADAANAWKKGWEEATAKLKVKAPVVDNTTAEEDQNKAKAKANAQRQAIQDFYDGLALQKKKVQTELLLFEDANFTKETIELKKQELALLTQMEDQKNAAILGILKQRLQHVRELQVEQYAVQKEQDDAFQNEILARNQAYQEMTAEQQRAFVEKNKAALEAQLTTRRTQLAAAAKAEAEIQIKAHNQFLLDQQKFGTAYAAINQAMHSAVYTGTKTAFGELEQLQQSSSQTLKSIGKVAAVANIVIRTAESAMNIYAGFSTIPIIGPALGVAGAAAAIAFGAEQIGKVQGAADGALVSGGIPGVDSVPFMLQQGELVAPAKNFDEVVGSVAAQRAGQSLGGGNEAVVGLLTNINEQLAAKGNDNHVHIHGDAIGDPAWVQAMAKALSNGLEFSNIKIYGLNTGKRFV